MRHFSLLLSGLFLIFVMPTGGITPTAARANRCPEIVRVALEQTGDLCLATGRNEICYGHSELRAEPQPHAVSFQLDEEGDVAGIDEVQSLRFSRMDAAANTWGIGLMRLQANLPDNQPEQNATIVLFGDVEMTNRANDAPLAQATVNSAGRVNVRATPSLDADVLGRLESGQQVTATGRLIDNSWVRIRLPATGEPGWVAGNLLARSAGLQALAVVNAADPYFGPMQAFTFQSADEDSQCAEMPDSGLVIQTPEGAAEISLLINEVDVQLGSTVYFQARPAGNMVVHVIEGSVHAKAFDTEFTALPGTQITIPLGEDLTPVGPPTPPAPYDPAKVQALPYSLLARPVVAQPSAGPSPAIPVVTTPMLGAVSAGENPAPIVVTGDGEDLTEAPPTGVPPTDVPPTDLPPTDDTVIICHLGITLEISIGALVVYLALGATLGPC